METKQASRTMACVRLGLLTLILGIVPVGGYAVETNTSPSSNARLAKVSVSAEGRLVPDSGSDPRSYAVLVPSSKAFITVTATAQDANATVQVNGTATPNGAPSGLVPLEHGLNILDVAVTAQDGKTQEHYEVKVMRAYPMPNWAKALDQAPFTPRDSAGELTFKNRMWLFGGYIPDVIGDIWSSADGIAWEKAGEMPDNNTINVPVCFVHDGKMWMATCQGRFYSSKDGKQWDLVSQKLPWGSGCGATFKARMWVVGGAEGREVWSSSDGKEWKQEVAKAPWSMRTHFGNVVSHAGKLWVIGGCLGKYQPYKAYSDIWCSEDGVKWTLVTDHAPWPVRRWTCCAVYRNRIWVLGGFRAQPTWQNFYDVWYSADGKDWRQLITEDIWSPRHELSAYVHDDRLWVVAGNSWPLVNDVWKLHIPGMVFLTQPVQEEYVNAGYEYRAQADFNESAGPILYKIAKGPKWLSVDPKTGVISGTPPAAGDFPIVVEARDHAGETARQSYSLHVVPL